ncbi:MAG TPA: response regulator transcription factor [Herpetosiphonaceae bacterium]
MAIAAKPAPRARQGTILVVEDELRSQHLLRSSLEALGYQVVTLDQAAGVIDAVEAHTPDLIVLGINVPDHRGFEVCQRIRAQSSVPVIIVSAFGQPADKARGLELGADDYIAKPYDTIELSARIKAVLRRVQGRPMSQSALFSSGPLTIDYDQRLVTLNGQEVQLSRTEYRLLEQLALNAGRTLVADALLSKVWGPEYIGDYASLHLYVSRLRRKLGEDGHASRLIVTRPGIGYMMPNDYASSAALKERTR